MIWTVLLDWQKYDAEVHLYETKEEALEFLADRLTIALTGSPVEEGEDPIDALRDIGYPKVSKNRISLVIQKGYFYAEKQRIESY